MSAREGSVVSQGGVRSGRVRRDGWSGRLGGFFVKATVVLVDGPVSSEQAEQAEQVRSSWRESRRRVFDVGVAILC
jgi:hypothetical protein